METENLNRPQLYSIWEAYNRGVRSSNIDPRDQLPPWLIEGIRTLEAQEPLSGAVIEEFIRMGGTDHPDPTLRSMGK